MPMIIWEIGLSKVPDTVADHIETNFPGSPGSGGSDYASFVAAGAPAFNLSSLNWSYWNYTWHTNRDTYDKIVFDDVRNNVILLQYLPIWPVKTVKRLQENKSTCRTTKNRRT